jgi:sugar phosphate isomerase/epimerase
MKYGYHAVYDANYFNAIDYAARVGFDFVQFDLGVPTFFLDKLSDSTLQMIREHATAKGVEITFHAPGDNVSLFADYPLIRKGILDQFELILRKANVLRARHVTMHLGDYPQFKEVRTQPRDAKGQFSHHYETVLYENLTALLAVRGEVLLCVENYNLDALKLRVLAKLLQHDSGLSLALDIPKLYNRKLEQDEKVTAFMRAYANSIKEIHVHDLHRELGSHQVVGEGELDFRQYRELLAKEDQYITFEVRPRDKALVAKERLIAKLEE